MQTPEQLMRAAIFENQIAAQSKIGDILIHSESYINAEKLKKLAQLLSILASVTSALEEMEKGE